MNVNQIVAAIGRAESEHSETGLAGLKHALNNRYGPQILPPIDWDSMRRFHEQAQDRERTKLAQAVAAAMQEQPAIQPAMPDEILGSTACSDRILAEYHVDVSGHFRSNKRKVAGATLKEFAGVASTNGYYFAKVIDWLSRAKELPVATGNCAAIKPRKSAGRPATIDLYVTKSKASKWPSAA